MERNYPESIKRVLAHEGGYTNHPSDPGGPTNFGITIADYRKYVKPGATAADVRAMKLDDAKIIYKTRYWATQSGDKLDDGVDYCIFDYGVNSGIGRSGKVLRRLLGMPDNTSSITAEVIEKANKKDPSQLSAAICDERMRFLQSLKTWPTFGAGWGRRVKEVKSISAVMAKQVDTPPVAPPLPLPPVETPPTTGRAEVPQPNVEAPAAGGTVAAGAAAGTGFWDWVAAHPIPSILIAATVIVAIVAVVQIIKQHYRDKQEAPPPNWVPPVIADRAPIPQSA